MTSPTSPSFPPPRAAIKIERPAMNVEIDTSSKPLVQAESLPHAHSFPRKMSSAAAVARMFSSGNSNPPVSTQLKNPQETLFEEANIKVQAARIGGDKDKIAKAEDVIHRVIGKLLELNPKKYSEM